MLLNTIDVTVINCFIKEVCMAEFPVRVSINKVADNSNIFEFTISTPILRSQFRLPRKVVNQLRGMIETALTSK